MKRESGRDLMLSVLSISTTVVLIALFWTNNLILTPLVLLCAAVLLAFWHEAEDLVCFGFVMVVGTASELIAVASGAWTYNNPSLLGIPVWLPVAWGIAALCLRRFVAVLRDARSVRN